MTSEIKPSRQPSAKSVSDLKLRVLIVEDHPINQIVTESLLKKLGCTCMIAADGHQALIKIDQHEFDLIIMDCHMPVKDGYTATVEIRNHADVRISQLPVIAVTANVSVEDRKLCVQSGMNAVVPKPTLLPELEAAIAKLFL